MSENPTRLKPSESKELLALAQEAGRLAVVDWDVVAGTVQASEPLRTIYGLPPDFDGRYDTWLKCVFREDLTRLLDIMDNTFAALFGVASGKFQDFVSNAIPDSENNTTRSTGKERR